MRVRLMSACALVVAAGLSVSAYAADLVSLGWGEFRPSEENTVAAKAVTLAAGANELTLDIALAPLTATAEGETTEGAVSYAGDVAVAQPDYISLPQMRIELHGQVVKTEGTEARIEVSVGGVTRVVEWPVDQAVAENFVKVIDAEVPGGQLPAPFAVSANIVVKKPTAAGASLISLQQIKVKVGQQRVALVGK
jgi:hypothetical protein